MPEARDHGPLPVFLIVLTGITGLVDAVSYLEFGNVFVANATGNVIFLGFRLGGREAATGAFVATTVSTVFFCVGAAFGGRLKLARLAHRGHLLCAGATVQACGFVIAALLMTSLGHTPALERLGALVGTLFLGHLATHAPLWTAAALLLAIAAAGFAAARREGSESSA
ncbi:YoaK family protein [Actinomadura algeriensis]|uniref:Uncharacterized membrane protein YoaK (UPF0700 family) n=1 Tax=Actinomadura algeriensis TaxID=1679523 RepID=A0ABR9JKU7_9ACTN|nr:YoaK family protein [Actinomadura algeriensis]MBE1531177.1 uncharacterized membrane protein YoaK (UPF0700 family) [Actinomadura algeriensis]